MSQTREKFATQVNTDILAAIRTLGRKRRPPVAGACGRGFSLADLIEKA
jgi:hypothetical protein